MKGHRGKQRNHPPGLQPGAGRQGGVPATRDKALPPLPLRDQDTSTLSTASYTRYSGNDDYFQEAPARRLRVVNGDIIRSQQASISHVASRSTLSPVSDLWPDFDGAAEVSSYVSSVDRTNKGPLRNRHDTPTGAAHEHRAMRPTRSAVEFANAAHFLRANRADNEAAPGAVEFAHATHFLDGPPHGSPSDASQRQRTARFIDTVSSAPLSMEEQHTVASPTASAIDFALGDRSDSEHLSPSRRGSPQGSQDGGWLPPRESLEYGIFRKGEYSNPRRAPVPPIATRSGNPGTQDRSKLVTVANIVGKFGGLRRRISERRTKDKDGWRCRGLPQQVEEKWEWSP